MAKIKVTQEVVQVDLTFWRLTRVFWSQMWRAILLTAPVFIGIFFYGVYKGLENIQFDKIFDVLNISLSIHYFAFLLFLYLFQCLLFRLVIGLKYADFTLSFVPKMDHHTSGYWPAIFYVSWAYSWRTILVMFGFRLFEQKFPNLSEISGIAPLSFFLEACIDIFLLRFVLNQQYGKIRLSLLAPEPEV